MRTNNIIWLGYIALVVIAILCNGEEHPFISYGPLAVGKYIMWLAFLGFTAYSYYCGERENLFRTIKTMLSLHWGRQIGADLYIGLSLFITLTFFHQDNVLVPLLWMVPSLYFVNLATLLYVALHYDSIVFMLMN